MSLFHRYHTHVDDFLGSLADEIWDGPKGGQDPLYALAVALQVVLQTCRGGWGGATGSLHRGLKSWKRKERINAGLPFELRLSADWQNQTRFLYKAKVKISRRSLRNTLDAAGGSRRSVSSAGVKDEML